MKHHTLLVSLFGLAAIAGCSHTPLEPAKAPVTTAQPTTAPATPPANTSMTHVATVNVDPLDDPKSGLAERSVYFAFDDFSVDEKYRPLIEKHGQYIAAHPKAHVRVEGNADERGSSEYNLALGDKRAQVVARQLGLMGAKPEQVEAISYGKEKPKATGHDEAAWAENRRADIRYLQH